VHLLNDAGEGMDDIDRIYRFAHDRGCRPLPLNRIGLVTGMNDERNVPIGEVPANRDGALSAEAKIDDRRREMGVVRDGPCRVQSRCRDDARTGLAEVVFYVEGDQGFVLDEKDKLARKEIQSHAMSPVHFGSCFQIWAK
jgi:hypothetical protein